MSLDDEIARQDAAAQAAHSDRQPRVSLASLPQFAARLSAEFGPSAARMWPIKDAWVDPVVGWESGAGRFVVNDEGRLLKYQEMGRLLGLPGKYV